MRVVSQNSERHTRLLLLFWIDGYKYIYSFDKTSSAIAMVFSMSSSVCAKLINPAHTYLVQGRLLSLTSFCANFQTSLHHSWLLLGSSSRDPLKNHPNIPPATPPL